MSKTMDSMLRIKCFTCYPLGGATIHGMVMARELRMIQSGRGKHLKRHVVTVQRARFCLRHFDMLSCIDLGIKFDPLSV